MNETQDTEFITSEFPLAATLLCLEINLVEMQKSKEDESRIEFLFSKDELIEKMIAGYWAGSLLVEPKRFWSYCRELKSRIKSQ